MKSQNFPNFSGIKTVTLKPWNAHGYGYENTNKSFQKVGKSS